MLELYSGEDEHGVHIRWRHRHSFYGGTHPIGRALGHHISYTPTERAAVSRSLSRLERRGLVDVYVREGETRPYTVVLTGIGLETAEALCQQGVTRDYKDLFPDGMAEVKDICYAMLADKGITTEDLPESLSMAIERRPVSALRTLFRTLAIWSARVNCFEEE